MARVLVIVVTYNAMQWIDRCLGSLRDSSQGVDVMVIDNGSRDGSCAHIQENYPEVQLVRSGANLGFGAANNIGLRRVLVEGYDFAYLLNQDAWVEPDTIGTLISCSKAGYGVLSPLQMDARGRMDRRFEAHCGKALRTAGNVKVVTVPFVMAAHWLISRDALETVGGFSPAFRHYGEDDNWLDRMRWHGMSAGVMPAARAVHDRAERKLSCEQRMALKCVGPVVRINDPSRPFVWRCLLGPLEYLGMAVKNLSLIPVKNIPSFVKRYGEFCKLRRQYKKKKAFL